MAKLELSTLELLQATTANLSREELSRFMRQTELPRWAPYRAGIISLMGWFRIPGVPEHSWSYLVTEMQPVLLSTIEAILSAEPEDSLPILRVAVLDWTHLIWHYVDPAGQAGETRCIELSTLDDVEKGELTLPVTTISLDVVALWLKQVVGLFQEENLDQDSGAGNDDQAAQEPVQEAADPGAPAG